MMKSLCVFKQDQSFTYPYYMHTEHFDKKTPYTFLTLQKCLKQQKINISLCYALTVRSENIRFYYLFNQHLVPFNAAQFSILGSLSEKNYNECSAILYVDSNLSEQLVFKHYPVTNYSVQQNSNKLALSIYQSQLNPQMHPLLDSTLLLKQQLQIGSYDIQGLNDKNKIEITTIEQFSAIHQTKIVGPQLIHQLILQNKSQIVKMQKQQLFYGDTPGVILSNWIDNGKNNLELIISIEQKIVQENYTYILARYQQQHYCILQGSQMETIQELNVTDQMHLSPIQYIKKYLDVEQSSIKNYIQIINVLPTQNLNDPFFDCVVEYLTNTQSYYEQQVSKDFIPIIQEFFFFENKPSKIEINPKANLLDECITTFILKESYKQLDVFKFQENIMQLMQNHNIYNFNIEQLFWIMWVFVLQSDNNLNSNIPELYLMKSILYTNIPLNNIQLFGIQWSAFDFGTYQFYLLLEILKIIINTKENKYYIQQSPLYEYKQQKNDMFKCSFNIFQEKEQHEAFKTAINTQNIIFIQQDVNAFKVDTQSISCTLDNLPDMNYEDVSFNDVILSMNNRSSYQFFQNIIQQMLQEHSDMSYCGVMEIEVSIQSENKVLKLIKCKHLCFIQQNIIEMIQQQLNEQKITINEIFKLEAIQQFDQNFKQNIKNQISQIETAYKQNPQLQFMYQQINIIVNISGYQLSENDSLFQHLVQQFFQCIYIYHDNILHPVKFIIPFIKQEHEQINVKECKQYLQNTVYQVVSHNNYMIDTQIPFLCRAQDILLFLNKSLKPVSLSDISNLNQNKRQQCAFKQNIIFFPCNNIASNYTLIDKLLNVMQQLNIFDLKKAFLATNVDYNKILSLLHQYQLLKYAYTYGDQINNEVITNVTQLQELSSRYIYDNLLICQQLEQELFILTYSQVQSKLHETIKTELSLVNTVVNLNEEVKKNNLYYFCMHLSQPLQRINRTYTQFPEMNYMVYDNITINGLNEVNDDYLYQKVQEIMETNESINEQVEEFIEQEIEEQNIFEQISTVQEEQHLEQKEQQQQHKQSKQQQKLLQLKSRKQSQLESSLANSKVLEKSIKQDSPRKSRLTSTPKKQNKIKSPKSEITISPIKMEQGPPKVIKSSQKFIENQKSQQIRRNNSQEQISDLFDTSLYYEDFQPLKEEKYKFQLLDDISLHLKAPINQLFNLVSPRFKAVENRVDD